MKFGAATKREKVVLYFKPAQRNENLESCDEQEKEKESPYRLVVSHAVSALQKVA